ncbi:MAG: type III pantothenate kinase [Paramuribaculum sp.]|nr:type III pantothenate kinase [Paramuribaculum sp.]
MLSLTIDQGNTAAKLALWLDSEPVAMTIESRLTPATVERFVRSAPGGDLPGAAIYCSVSSRGSDLLSRLRTFIPRVLRLTADMPLPLRIGYDTPSTLGADRIAAAAGAMAMFPRRPLLVVDAGTAVTYDYVTADGVFAGGNIAPGMTMRLEALHRFTARLPRLEMPRDLEPGRLLGTDTASAMILGAAYGITGAIGFYRRRLPDDTVTVVTGGWAPTISRLTDIEVHTEPNLVSRGLISILSYNENIS